MRNSLLKKYLAGSSVILLISFLILGLVMTSFVNRYLETEKINLITSNSQEFSDYFSNELQYDGVNIKYKDKERMQEAVSKNSEIIECDLFITDVSGYIIMSGSYRSGNIDYTRKSVATSNMKNITKEGLYEKGTLDGFFQNQHLTYVSPIYNSENNNQIICYIFTAVDTDQIYDSTLSVVSLFIYSSIASFIIIFCIIFFYTSRTVKPLKEMSKVAKAFAGGDFSQKVNINSKDEIGQLADAFNELADYISSSENMRRNFIANVSHELKTPMTTIGGFIDGILDGTIPKEEQNKYLNIVSDEIKRLSRLVTSMLSLSRIDSGELKLQKQSFNLSETIISTLLTFERQINEKHISIVGLEDLPRHNVEGDPDLIHQVVYNLLENAVKFTNENGTIKIRITETTTSTSVEVTNTGKGIPEEDIKLIFDKFYKTDKSRNEDKIGMGLGLYIVRVILSLHEGGINAKSKPSEYTCFNFWLPKPHLKEQHMEVVAKINAMEDDE